MADPSDDDDVPFEVNVRPDLSKTNQVTSFTEGVESKKIRLGCIHCDREDFDGVVELPADWHDIFPVQTWEESIQPVEFHDPLRRSVFAWETHLGVCPECNEEYDREEVPPKSGLQWQESEADDSDEREFQESINVHPIIRQIIDRDCHVSESNSRVVRHVISKLRNGYETFRAMNKIDRRKFIEQCVEHHGRNYKEYVEVMSGFRYTTEGKGKTGDQISSLPGPEIVKLMRKYNMTIAQLAFRLGTSQKRVRQARELGLIDPYAIRDWIQGICGVDVGPVPEKYRVRNKQEEGECCFCGYPLYIGDPAYEYAGEMFCSITCSRKSRGW